MKIDTWNLVADIKSIDEEKTKLVIRNRSGESISLNMKHDLTKPGCINEVIDDLKKIVDGLKEYERDPLSKLIQNLK